MIRETEAGESERGLAHEGGRPRRPLLKGEGEGQHVIRGTEAGESERGLAHEGGHPRHLLQGEDKHVVREMPEAEHR